MADQSRQITEDQHFVPKFYLKGFADAKGNLNIYDADQTRISKPRPYSSVCHDKFFYGVETGLEDEVSQQIEFAFSQMESDIAAVLPGIIERIETNKHIDGDDRLALATLMSMLWMRGPAMRKQLNRMNEDMTKKLMAMTIDERSLAKFEKEQGRTLSPEEKTKLLKVFKEEKYGLKFNNVQHLRFFQEIEGFRNLFYGKWWNVYLAKGNLKFVTSDNPVVEWFPPRKKPFFYGVDFLSRHHHFALTPSIHIEALYPHHFESKKSRRTTLFDNDKVQDLNMTIARYAGRYVYSSSPIEIETMHAEIEGAKKDSAELVKLVARSVIK